MLPHFVPRAQKKKHTRVLSPHHAKVIHVRPLAQVDYGPTATSALLVHLLATPELVPPTPAQRPPTAVSLPVLPTLSKPIMGKILGSILTYARYAHLFWAIKYMVLTMQSLVLHQQRVALPIAKQVNSKMELVPPTFARPVLLLPTTMP